MPLKNTFALTKTTFENDIFLKNTGNVFKYVSQRPYLDKNGRCGVQGTTLTLMVIHDDTDYGYDKETGEVRDNNVFETFDVTILNGKTHENLNKGDNITLLDYDAEHSYVIGFDLILRYKSYELVEEAD